MPCGWPVSWGLLDWAMGTVTVNLMWLWIERVVPPCYFCTIWTIRWEVSHSQLKEPISTSGGSLVDPFTAYFSLFVCLLKSTPLLLFSSASLQSNTSAPCCGNGLNLAHVHWVLIKTHFISGITIATKPGMSTVSFNLSCCLLPHVSKQVTWGVSGNFARGCTLAGLQCSATGSTLWRHGIGRNRLMAYSTCCK